MLVFHNRLGSNCGGSHRSVAQSWLGAAGVVVWGVDEQSSILRAVWAWSAPLDFASNEVPP